MAKKITLVESIISVGFDDKVAQNGLKKLKRQLKDQDKTSAVTQRRDQKAQQRKIKDAQRNERQIRLEHRAQSRERRAEESHDMRKEKHSQTLSNNAKKERRAKQKERRLDARERRMTADAQSRLNIRNRNAIRLEARERRMAAAQQSRLDSSAYSRSRKGSSSSVSTGLSTGGVVGAAGAGYAATGAMQTTMAWENAMNALFTQEASRGGTTEQAAARTQAIADRIYKMADAFNVNQPEVLLDAFNQLRPLATGSEGKYTDDHIMGMVSSITQSSKATGLSGPMFERFMLGFRQFAANLSSQTASGQEIGQMRDASAVLTNMFFEAMGLQGNITPDAMAKMVQGGELGLDQVMEAGAQMQDTSKAGFTKYKETSLQGKLDELTKMYAHSQRVFGAASKGGAMHFLKQLSVALSENEELFRSAGEWTGNLLTSLGDGIKYLSETWKAMPQEDREKMLETLRQLGVALGTFVVSATLFKLIKALTKVSAATGLSALLAVFVSMSGLLDRLSGSDFENLQKIKNKQPNELTEEDKVKLNEQPIPLKILDFYKDINTTFTDSIKSLFGGVDSVGDRRNTSKFRSSQSLSGAGFKSELQPELNKFFENIGNQLRDPSSGILEGGHFQELNVPTNFNSNNNSMSESMKPYLQQGSTDNRKSSTVIIDKIELKRSGDVGAIVNDYLDTHPSNN